MNMNSKSSVNEFTIKIANVNGTGSASANGLLMKSLFRMGIPVVGKNYFPSNIQGLPTWYEIRASEKGYLARSGKVDIMVAMNAETYKHDLAEVVPGGYLIYDSTWPRSSMLTRDDITIIGVPLSRMCNENFPSARARILMKNVVYVGVIAALLDLDMELISSMLNQTFAKKASLLEGNQLGVVVAEKDPVIGLEGEETSTAGREANQYQCQQDDGKAPANQPFCVTFDHNSS